jgi:hypothetical protein
MTIQMSVGLRDARLDQLETTVGTSPTIEIRTGSPPANCAAADSGSLLATISLPSDWMAASSSGSKAKSGTWSVSASGTGTAGHFRLKASGGTCHMQGTAGVSATDMILDNASIASGQTVTVTAFTLNENAHA